MKVAVPEHQGRIAPVFDSCRRVLVYAGAAEPERLTSDEDWSCCARHCRPQRLAEMGVETLLCGGISCWLAEQVRVRGIRLFAWLSGDVASVLAAFRDGKIDDPRYAMPGARGCALRQERPRACGPRRPSHCLKRTRE